MRATCGRLLSKNSFPFTVSIAENNNNPSSAPEHDDKDLLRMRLDYAWNWFDLHAKQRMSLFRYFLIITGILVSGYVTAFVNDYSSLIVAIGVIGAFQSAAFIAFDFRSRELTRRAENVLEKIERDMLFPDSFSHHDIRQGESLGLLKHEAAAKMREGYGWKRGWKNIKKIKWWIRAIEGAVLIAFLMGIFLWSS